MSLSSAWKQKDKAATLEARFEFASFEILRDFLDEVADVADNVGHHPNLSFGREHV
ncbi:4a-hydroxytetrahydrobiopterin dehydratase, partial [Thiomicrorhabdus sp. 6S2-11]